MALFVVAETSRGGMANMLAKWGGSKDALVMVTTKCIGRPCCRNGTRYAWQYA